VSDYTYDVFISYPRRGETALWVRAHFEPALRHSLALELDRDPKIYFDQKIKPGTTWPIELGRKLARSRVLVSLWTRNYLRSEWCALELAHMLGRERETGRRSVKYPNGVITIPIIHDGATIPEDLRMIQAFEIKKYFNPRMRKDSKKAEGLYDVLMEKAESLAELVEGAPNWRPQWSKEAVDDFLQLFKKQLLPANASRPRFTEL
jgi:hypothetical protein